MKINKKLFIVILFISLLLILIGVYAIIAKGEQKVQNEEKNKRLNEIVEKFNEREITAYFEDENVEMKAKSSSSTLTLYYLKNEKETTGYTFQLKNNILESNEVVDEITIGHLLDTILNLKETSAYSFLGVINNHTVLDYSLEEDGIEFTKEENGYQLKINIDKTLVVKEFFDVVITLKDYQSDILKTEYQGATYNQKGYILFKEETDIKGNKVVTFAQYMDCNIENLRQSIANYLESVKGQEIKDRFLAETSSEALEIASYTRDNYELINSYLVFKEDLIDECFSYYLSNNYRVVTLIVNQSNQ